MQTTDQTTQNTQPESSQDRPDDLLESLLLLCNLYGVSTTKDALTSGLPLINGRLTPNLLARAASRARLTCKINKAELSQIPTEFLPAMLLLEGEGACLLLGWDAEKKQARVILPSVGEAEVQLTVEELASRYQGIVVVFNPNSASTNVHQWLAMSSYSTGSGGSCQKIAISIATSCWRHS